MGAWVTPKQSNHCQVSLQCGRQPPHCLVPPFQLTLYTLYILAAAPCRGEVLEGVSRISGKVLMTLPLSPSCKKTTSPALNIFCG